jgi:hypothetical protein
MPPVVIAGAIAGAGAIGSAVIGAGAASKAAKANQAAADTAAAETRAARNQAYSTLQPYINAGLPATQTINALLGLGGTSGSAAVPGQSDYAAYVNANPDLKAEFSRVSSQFGGDPAAYGQYHWQNFGQNEGRTLPTSGGSPAVSAQDAQGAFDQFRNSTGYDFRVKQGMNALNSGYAGAGTIKSGAAIKGAVDYGQGMASQEFGNYLNALGNQQSLGYQAGSSAAGVGTQSANSLGSIYMQNGANQANASLAKASALGSGLSSLANIGGSILAGSGTASPFSNDYWQQTGRYNSAGPNGGWV